MFLHRRIRRIEKERKEEREWKYDILFMLLMVFCISFKLSFHHRNRNRFPIQSRFFDNGRKEKKYPQTNFVPFLSDRLRDSIFLFEREVPTKYFYCMYAVRPSTVWHILAFEMFFCRSLPPVAFACFLLLPLYCFTNWLTDWLTDWLVNFFFVFHKHCNGMKTWNSLSSVTNE